MILESKILPKRSSRLIRCQLYSERALKVKAHLRMSRRGFFVHEIILFKPRFFQGHFKPHFTNQEVCTNFFSLQLCKLAYSDLSNCVSAEILFILCLEISPLIILNEYTIAPYSEIHYILSAKLNFFFSSHWSHSCEI